MKDEGGVAVTARTLEEHDDVPAVRLLEDKYPAGCCTTTAWHDAIRADGDEA